MATTIQLLRSDISQQRPEPGVLANGTPMVNTYEDEPGLFFAARDGSLFKVGPASVGTFAPNSFPQGQTGNCLGELWVDTSGANPALKFFDGSAFISAFTSPSVVTSVGLVFSDVFTVTGSPVTGAGTLTANLSPQAANAVFAGPGSGSAATPTFRVLVAADIPNIAASTVTSGTFASARIPTALNSHTFTGITPDADATRDLGSPSLRWANIYSADLNLSNEGASNDVDETWGSYTIQEGEEDLYLINRRSGKRYKFLLQEV